MLKTLRSTLRGLKIDAAKPATARADLTLLTRQLNEAGSAVRSARMAFARAPRQHKQDRNTVVRMDATIAELQARTETLLMEVGQSDTP